MYFCVIFVHVSVRFFVVSAFASADHLVLIVNTKQPASAPAGGKLSSESVEGLSLPLEGIDDIHGGDGLPASVLGVGDGITDDVLKEDLKDSAGLLVDQATDALDSTPACQTADGRLGDALDVVAQHLPVALGTTLSESLSSFSASCRGWVGGVGLVYVLWVAVGRLRGARIDCESLPIHNKSLGGCGSLCCNSGDTKFPPGRAILV